ncbi:MAG TPA: UvrD-helicase domain-containing protein, partial [Candidatus Limnocylindrales bacterium]|nr:UvrD-helicase domain-containing protein [Candidatus Limnocylindrales bacterium]
MSPTPSDKPAKRPRTRRAEPVEQGTWLDLGPETEAPAATDGPAGSGSSAEAPATVETAVADEPDWLRDVPPDPGLADAGPAVAPEDIAKAIEARRAARAEEILSRMNPEQGRAVSTTEGPLLILAGAGSGKTRVVAHRIAYLIGVKAVRPYRILAVTFTNRAAGELRERITHLVGDHGKDVEAGTFHALCARVLRRDGDAIGLDRRFVIYDTDDQQQLMKRILAEEDLPATGEFRPAAILGAISRAKNEMLDETFLAENAVNHRERIIAKLAARYRERLEAAHALDFDDLLL